ncbi:MAG: PilZ domain-containing protein [Myxococcales bacterium]|nr:PilZ domain-containing protein [Myxococcales bacterium]
MESRRVDRTKRRFMCQIVHEDERHDGIVMNITADGIFVLTSAMIPSGTQVRIQISELQEVPQMTLRAIVIRQHLVPDESSRLMLQGLGMQILQAPSAFYELSEPEKESS